jgi:transposase
VATERNTPAHRAYRRAFCARLLALNLRRLVFLDESFCKTGMRREHGWSRRGTRVQGTRPFRAWKTLSLIGAIRVGERPRLMTHHGPVNGPVFLRFVKKRLCPWLRRGDVVFLDNLNIHKMRAVRDAIEAVGATPVYLPTYSPELNPIELWWADMKRHLRKLGADVLDGLAQAARRLRASLALSKLDGWFRRALSFAQGK